jgi:hypothetical protein
VYQVAAKQNNESKRPSTTVHLEGGLPRIPSKSIIAERRASLAHLTPCDDELADLSIYTKFMSRQPATACPSTAINSEIFNGADFRQTITICPKQRLAPKGSSTRVRFAKFPLSLVDAEGNLA